jgi:hypothetical protein
MLFRSRSYGADQGRFYSQIVAGFEWALRMGESQSRSNHVKFVALHLVHIVESIRKSTYSG